MSLVWKDVMSESQHYHYKFESGAFLLTFQCSHLYKMELMLSAPHISLGGCEGQKRYFI